MQYTRPEHPRPDWERKDWMNLNGPWEFRFDSEDRGISEQWFSNKEINFPDRINVPFSWASPLSGIHQNVKGAAWYRRKAEWQPHQPGSRIFLCFGGVDYRCDLWVNGTHMGTHTGGYHPFEFEVTGCWNLTGINEVTVRAEDRDEPFQTRGTQGYGEIRGIWQTLWLEARPRQFLRGVRFTTRMDGRITAKVTVSSEAPAHATIGFRFDGVSHRVEVNLKGGENRFETNFRVAAPRLWSPEAPYIYEGNVSLESAGGGTDTVATYFGIREVGTASFDGRKFPWITLNGKPVYLNGTLDQSFNPEGFFTYPSDEEMKNEIWRLRRLGLNLVRIHIKPEEPRKLYWADKLGMLVMADMPNFWGEPEEKARIAHEIEAGAIIERDFNHPSIIAWVLFNETWGLLSKNEEGNSVFLPETQDWVKQRYEWAKKEDPTRLVEDNSPCRNDHVLSDINSWHFYTNGYPAIRAEIQNAVEKTFPDSDWNYIGEHRQTEAPLMNSECGAVWGIEGGAGDSDLAWHYRYMMNEFRRHEKICGFIFTEFHDVTNEFNGYYRIDNRDKDFGYDWFVPDMSLRDLHSPDFIVIDAPPCVTAKPLEKVTVLLSGSNFSPELHGQTLTVGWELWYDRLGRKIIAGTGEIPVKWQGYGMIPVGDLALIMPKEEAVAVLAVMLKTPEGRIVSRNFTTFDVQSAEPGGIYDLPGGWMSIRPEDFLHQEWPWAWTALNGHKVNGGGSGFCEYRVELPQTAASSGHLEIYFEAGAKMVLPKDQKKTDITGKDFMQGDRDDPGENPNSYFMTDETLNPSLLQVYIDDELVAVRNLPDDPADSRGVLSWRYQPVERKLEEAGSYGYLQKVTVPSRLIPGILRKGSFTLRLEVPAGLSEGAGGLALYGRNSGRYPIDILAHYW